MHLQRTFVANATILLRIVIITLRQQIHITLVEIGNSGLTFEHTNFPSGILKFTENNFLTIAKDDKGIKVSVLIRDKNGNAVAELIKNEWKVNKNNSYDRNYSKDALEVKDNTGDIILQIRLLQDRVQIQAKLYDSNGSGVAVTKDRDGSGVRFEFTINNREALEAKIKPIFKYPSELHLGEFVDK